MTARVFHARQLRQRVRFALAEADHAVDLDCLVQIGEGLEKISVFPVHGPQVRQGPGQHVGVLRGSMNRQRAIDILARLIAPPEPRKNPPNISERVRLPVGVAHRAAEGKCLRMDLERLVVIAKMRMDLAMLLSVTEIVCWSFSARAISSDS